MAAKQILVTGGTGFVGANLVRRLVHDGHTVHLLVRQGYASWRIESIRHEVQMHPVDMRDADSLTAVVASIRPEWTFHLAVYGAYSSQSDVRQIIQTNIVNTVNLVEACLKTGFEAFVNTGSSSEYGFKDHAPTEKEWVDPNSYYAVSKVSAAHYIRYSAQRYKQRMPTLRLYSVYGPYEEPTRLLPTLVLYGLSDRLPPLVNPNIARDYVYVDDVSEAYLCAAAGHDPELGAIYNIGSGQQTTLREAVETVRRILNIGAEPQWGTMPDRSWDTDKWISDPSAIRRALGWQANVSFEEGLRQMIDWLRANPDMRDYYQTHRTVPG